MATLELFHPVTPKNFFHGQKQRKADMITENSLILSWLHLSATKNPRISIPNCVKTPITVSHNTGRQAAAVTKCGIITPNVRKWLDTGIKRKTPRVCVCFFYLIISSSMFVTPWWEGRRVTALVFEKKKKLYKMRCNKYKNFSSDLMSNLKTLYRSVCLYIILDWIAVTPFLPANKQKEVPLEDFFSCLNPKLGWQFIPI